MLADFRPDSRMLKLPAWRKGANVAANTGELAEWLRSGLQIRVHRFESGTRLQVPVPPGAAGRERSFESFRPVRFGYVEPLGGTRPRNRAAQLPHDGIRLNCGGCRSGA